MMVSLVFDKVYDMMGYLVYGCKRGCKCANCNFNEMLATRLSDALSEQISLLF